MNKNNRVRTLNEKWRIDGEIVEQLTDEQHAKEMDMPLDEYLQFKAILSGLKGMPFSDEMKAKFDLDYFPMGKELWEYYKRYRLMEQN